MECVVYSTDIGSNVMNDDNIEYFENEYEH